MPTKDEKYTERMESAIADILTERPQPVEIKGRTLYLYPLSLGRTFIVNRLIQTLGIDATALRRNPFIEALRLSREERETCTLILAYHTLRTREEVMDVDVVGERRRFLDTSLTDEEVAQLILMALTPENIDEVQKYLGIEAERNDMRRLTKIKDKKSNTISFGGRSVFGSIIVPACEKLGLTPNEAVWGISFAMLQMLLADAVTSVYLTDDEKRKAHITSDRTRIKADDPSNEALIKSMTWK